MGADRSVPDVRYPTVGPRQHARLSAILDSSSASPSKPKLLDRVREAIHTRHYSRRTEKAYVHWIKRYIFFHGKRHPGEMGAAEVTAFLTSLAVRDRVAASTQNQATADERLAWEQEARRYERLVQRNGRFTQCLNVAAGLLLTIGLALLAVFAYLNAPFGKPSWNISGGL